ANEPASADALLGEALAEEALPNPSPAIAPDLDPIEDLLDLPGDRPFDLMAEGRAHHLQPQPRTRQVGRQDRDAPPPPAQEGQKPRLGSSVQVSRDPKQRRSGAGDQAVGVSIRDIDLLSLDAESVGGGFDPAFEVAVAFQGERLRGPSRPG